MLPEHGANNAKRNKAQADGDPGDLVRALLYPGELGRSVLDAYACATDKKKSARARWRRPCRVEIRGGRSEAETPGREANSVFGSKKTTLIAGSFFTVGAAFQAATKGSPGTLGVFSVVALLWSLVSAGRAVAPDVGLVIVLAMTYQSYHTPAPPRGGARREEAQGRRSNACARRGRRRKPRRRTDERRVGRAVA